jgi:hypothetical protein
MARATAELGAALLLYTARNLDFYRGEIRKWSNCIYEDLHLHGSTESMIGRELAMIGFGRIGRTLVDLTRGFQLHWLVYDPYAPKSLAKQYPVRFSGLPSLLQNHDSRKPVLTGHGNFPLPEVRAALRQLRFDRFVSFEWEKKWHPEIADANVALSHFTLWFQENCEP